MAKAELNLLILSYLSKKQLLAIAQSRDPFCTLDRVQRKVKMIIKKAVQNIEV